tara:strand:- start:125 stop:349 length:225 start_codon:yes stop_codon:yes gene_type:complete
MCLICASIEKNQLTLNEAWRNLHEMYETIEEDHVGELLDKMMSIEMTSEEEDDEFFQYPIPFDEWDEWNNWGAD